MEIRKNKGSFSSLGGGCFLWFIALVGWGISALIFPKLPDYEKVMATGELVEGVVLRVENVENVRINGHHPKRVIYQFGSEGEAKMTMALGESVKKGKGIKVRVLGDHSYPVDIEPFKRPGWLKFVLIGVFVLGCITLGFGILKLLVIGGVLFAAGRSMTKKDSPPPPPGPPGPNDLPPPPPPGP